MFGFVSPSRTATLHFRILSNVHVHFRRAQGPRTNDENKDSDTPPSCMTVVARTKTTKTAALEPWRNRPDQQAACLAPITKTKV